jgi:Amidohydrolase family
VKTLLLALILSAYVAFAQQPVDSVIVHVTVINVTNGSELKDQAVHIHGNRIASVAPAQPADIAAPGAIDAHGAFLIPGLWDMHVHVHNTIELPLYIANGVTGIRIMSGDRDTAAYRAELARESPAPEIYLASAIVDGSPPVWPGSIVIHGRDDAHRAVDDIKASGADFIKVYSRIPRDAYFALAEEGKAQHIDFEGHVPDAITAQEASAAGQRSMEHLMGISFACSGRQQELMGALERAQFFRDRMAVEAQAYNSIDQNKCRALFAEFRQNETWQVPTLTVRRMWGRLDDSKFTSDPRLAYIDKRSRDRWQERIQPQEQRWNYAMYQMARGIFSDDERITGALFRSGVPIMAGTDAMNPFCFPGFSLHDELALLVESGLTPLAALQSATINPAKFMRRTADLGTVEAGKTANLVLLRADPLADIHNSTQIEAVWLEGQYFDKPALAAMLEKAKEMAGKH